jgi:hypothetical protein
MPPLALENRSRAQHGSEGGGLLQAERVADVLGRSLAGRSAAVGRGFVRITVVFRGAGLRCQPPERQPAAAAPGG